MRGISVEDVTGDYTARLGIQETFWMGAGCPAECPRLDQVHPAMPYRGKHTAEAYIFRIVECISQQRKPLANSGFLISQETSQSQPAKLASVAAVTTRSACPSLRTIPSALQLPL